MAEIKDFNRNQYLLKGKNKKNNTDTENSSSNKSADSILARHKQLKLYTVLAIILLFVIFIMFAYFHWKNIMYTQYEVIYENEWIRSKESKCMKLDNTLFNYSNDGMSCTDTKGKVIWNQTYEMQNPIVRTCQNAVAVGDYNGRKIYIANTQGSLGTIETTMPIRDFCVSSNGIVAAVLDDSTVTAIYLYDKAGEELVYFKTTMSKAGYPLGIDISNDGSLVAVSYVKAENGKITSNIGFYNFSSVGQNYTDNLVSGYGYSEAIIPTIHFMGNNTVFAVSDNRLMFFRGRQKPESLSDILISEQIQSVYYSQNYVGLVFFNPTGETKYHMDVYDTNANKVNEIDFNVEYTDILFDETAIVIRSDEECIIYDWDNRVKYEGLFTERISCMLTTGKISKYTLVTDDSIQNIELK